MSGVKQEESTQPDGSATDSPSMSQPPQQVAQTQSQTQAQQNVENASPSIPYNDPQAQYTYPMPQHGGDPYRTSPNGSGPSQHLTTMQQQNGQPQQYNLMPQPGQMAGPYYQAHPGMQYPNVVPDSMRQMSYSLPESDQRVMSGGRHKKEIKRRTKTGCLTCRKRRIKCDEGHPACRNCQKSKRDCLGYDPVFKNPHTAPSNIQPAPSSAPPNISNPYGNQPILQASYPQQPPMPYDQSLQDNLDPTHAAGHFQYSSAIDPSLETTAGAMAAQFPSQTIPGKIQIEDLIDQGGQAAPVTPAISNQLQDSSTLDEIKHLFHSIYSPGLENFLESKWFPSKGVTRLLGDTATMEQFVILLERFKLTQDINDVDAVAYTCSVEARVCWALAGLVREAADAEALSGQTRNPAASLDDAVEGANRLSVFENLVTGAVAPNLLTRPNPSVDAHRLRELEFWYQLAHFVSLVDDGSPGFVLASNNSMNNLRGLLDGRENRDVLYSIVVVRALGPRVAEYSEQETPIHLDETDARSKLAVAKKFVNDEGLGAGTTNVIRRFCELAARSWDATVAAPNAESA